MTIADVAERYHIVPQFPPAAVRAAANIPEKVSDIELFGRRNLTEECIFTIDSDDARDFDDAVSLATNAEGNYVLGVHIADASHYVTEDSAIDRAAYMRGTSVYLIDTVIPMLPFELSNGICSLVPNEVRLTVSVFIELTPRGRFVNYEICESYIKSCARLTYAEAEKILEGDSETRNRFAAVAEPLCRMRRLAEVLKRKRVRHGSVEFVTDETKITLDVKGKPVSVGKYPIGMSNAIIEEFMLLCNKTVAKHLASLHLPCVYRVHEAPDAERTARLATILPRLGTELPVICGAKPKDFAAVLKSVEGTDSESVVNYLVLRTMSKARYSEENLGHFGLSFEDYCHFTSPIRRYPDLAVHRILKESLHGEIDERRREELREIIMSVAVSSSMSEVNATDAEFYWKDIKKCEYMAEHIGEHASSIITHVTSWGFFAVLENTVEGFVPASCIEDDVYVISEDGLSLSGMNNKRTFTVGDRVDIVIHSADAERRRIDFDLDLRNMGSHAVRGRKDKRLLGELNDANYEARRESREAKECATAAKEEFDNAVSRILTEEIFSTFHCSKGERRFVSVTISDMASQLSTPLFRAALGRCGVGMENYETAGMRLAMTVLKTIEESIQEPQNKRLRKFCEEFVRGAVLKLEKNLGRDGMRAARRKNEYRAVAKSARRAAEADKR